MNKLEEKVRANSAVLDEKFINKNETDLKVSQTKTGFSDGWNNGWSNHGGPALTNIDTTAVDEIISKKNDLEISDAKRTKYGFSKGWDKGWGNYGGPPSAKTTISQD